MGIIRKVLLGLFALVAVVVAGLFLLPSDKIAKIAAQQISAQTGREVTISGDATMSFWPVLGVATGPMQIANAGWSKGGPMFEAQALKVGVDFGALIKGDIRITGLEAVAPRVLLERASDGRVNWELGVDGVAPAGQAAKTQANPLALSLDRAIIRDAQVVYVDHGTGTQVDIPGFDLDLRWPEALGAADFELALRPASQTVSVVGRAAEFAALIAGDMTGVVATVKAGGGTVSFDGMASIAPRAEGNLAVNLPDSTRFLTALGIAGQGSGMAVAVKGGLAVAPDLSIALTAMSAAIDGAAVSGDVRVSMGGARPKVSARLAAGVLDFPASEGSAGSGGAASEGWSKAPIDASALGLVDGDIAIKLAGLKAGGLTLGASDIVITIDRSRAVMALKSVQGYGGVISGEVVANNRKGLSVGGDVSAKGVDMKPLLTDLAGVSRFSGAATARLKFLASGGSADAIMRSMSGEGSVGFGKGQISGIDLDKLIRSGDASGGTTVFDSLTASFAIQAGDLRNSDLKLVLPGVEATGTGRVGLGARDIDYTVTPVALQARGGKGLAIPVRVRGPWGAPKFSADLAKAIDLNLADEKKALEDKARAKVNAKLEKELGVTVKEGQSVEEAVKEKVEDQVKKKLESEIQKGLGKLFKQ